MAALERGAATGVDQVHAEYRHFEEFWRLSRACVAGDAEIKKLGTEVLPMLAEETVQEYAGRQLYATVYEAADKVLDVLVGALFRKPGTRVLPPATEDHLDNIDLAGTPYEGFRQRIASERIETGRYGVLIDWNAAFGRPQWIGYETEQIRNWSYRLVDNRLVLDQVVLCEHVASRAPSGFGMVEQEQYRVLELNDAGIFESRIYRLDAEETQKQQKQIYRAVSVTRPDGSVTDVIIPNRQGVAFTEIPFVCFGQFDLSLCPLKPALLPICNLMLDHYRMQVDLKFGMHLRSGGALFVIGDGDERDPKKYYLGGTRANRLQAGASVQLLGFPEGVTDQLRAELASDEQRMALFGARMLLAPKRAAETAEAMLIQQEGESATLSAISYGLSLGLTQCWRHHVTWMGGDAAEVEETLNRDFADTRMAPDMIAAQLSLVTSGNMSKETFLENLYEGEITREPEVEQERLASEDVSAAPADGTELLPPEMADQQIPPTTDQGGQAAA